MKKPLLFLAVICMMQIAVGQSFKQIKKKTTPSEFEADVVIDGKNNFHQNQSIISTVPYQPISGSLRQKLAQSQLPSQSLNRIQAVDTKGLPTFIQTTTDGAENTISWDEVSAQQASFTYLREIKSLIKIDNPKQEFSVKTKTSDALNHWHVKLKQSYQDVPIYGAEVIVHLREDGSKMFNGRYHATPSQIAVQPVLNDSLAELAVLRHVSKLTHYRPLRIPERKILKYNGPSIELVLYPVKALQGQLKLAYHITIRPNFVERYEYFVDAQNGDILHHFDYTCSLGPKTGTGTDLNGVARSFGIFEDNSNVNYMMDASKSMFTGSSNQLPDLGDGIILTGDMRNTGTQNPSFYYVTSNNANSWAASEVSAHYNAGIAYDYFENTHNRNSINGSGGDIISFINVADDNGSGLDNAFWNGQAIFYGNGQSAFTPLAGALDVAGHEMSHGTVQETAGLEYQDESGALNESFADIFGVMIDRDDWTLGEEVVRTSAFPSGALRSMSDPHNGGNSLADRGWQPKRYSERYTGTQDNGGVHINSGIPNYAFYLIAQNIGKDKAEDIFYRALTQYLTRTSNFEDCRLAVQQSCIDLFGNNSAELLAAESAFATVEMPGATASGGGGGTGGPTPNLSDLPINPGDEYIVSTDVNNFDINTLYRSTTAGSNFEALSTTPHKKRVSVTDDSEWAYIVGTDDYVYRLRLDPNNPSQQIYSMTPEWDNAVVSKDGSKMAAITTFIDTSIFIFDLISGRSARFKLYNPTFSQGVNSGGVLYADALDWDYSGQYLMYDAFNRIPGTFGDDIEYWDVGIMNVWNNQTNGWGTGEIVKLFTQLDPGISVGNAVFSTNSPYIVAFDLIDQNANNVTVAAANIETGDVQAVFTQDVLGFPDYSNRDDKIVFATQDQSNNSIIAQRDMANDKITPNGQATGLIQDGTYPIWYADGVRSLVLDLEDGLVKADLQAKVYPNPVKDQFILTYHVEKRTSVKISLSDLSGKQIRTLYAGAPQQAGEHTFEGQIGDLAAGTYVLSIQAENRFQSMLLQKR